MCIRDRPIDTSKFAPQVAAQDALQTQAATLAGSGVGSFAPFIQAAQQQALVQQAMQSGMADPQKLANAAATSQEMAQPPMEEQ